MYVAGIGLLCYYKAHTDNLQITCLRIYRPFPVLRTIYRKKVIRHVRSALNCSWLGTTDHITLLKPDCIKLIYNMRLDDILAFARIS